MAITTPVSAAKPAGFDAGNNTQARIREAANRIKAVIAEVTSISFSTWDETPHGQEYSRRIDKLTEDIIPQIIASAESVANGYVNMTFPATPVTPLNVRDQVPYRLS